MRAFKRLQISFKLFFSFSKPYHAVPCRTVPWWFALRAFKRLQISFKLFFLQQTVPCRAVPNCAMVVRFTSVQALTNIIQAFFSSANRTMPCRAEPCHGGSLCERSSAYKYRSSFFFLQQTVPCRAVPNCAMVVRFTSVQALTNIIQAFFSSANRTMPCRAELCHGGSLCERSSAYKYRSSFFFFSKPYHALPCRTVLWWFALLAFNRLQISFKLFFSSANRTMPCRAELCHGGSLYERSSAYKYCSSFFFLQQTVPCRAVPNCAMVVRFASVQALTNIVQAFFFLQQTIPYHAVPNCAMVVRFASIQAL